MQGSVVPQVYVAGYSPGAELPRLAIEWLEPCNEHSRPTQQEISQAEAHLAAIHAAGVLHGDVRPSMLYKESGLHRFRLQLRHQNQQHLP